jgi:hypothetical protein
MATYHDPYDGQSFEEDGSEGSYNVDHLGHVLPYESLPGEAKSHCTCPICSKVFEVDVIPGSNDADPGILGFGNDGNLINLWMVI